MCFLNNRDTPLSVHRHTEQEQQLHFPAEHVRPIMQVKITGSCHVATNPNRIKTMDAAQVTQQWIEKSKTDAKPKLLLRDAVLVNLLRVECGIEQQRRRHGHLAHRKESLKTKNATQRIGKGRQICPHATHDTFSSSEARRIRKTIL